MRALTAAHSQYMKEEETDADSHMLTPRANSLMSDEHAKFLGINRDWAFYDQMFYVRHMGG